MADDEAGPSTHPVMRLAGLRRLLSRNELVLISGTATGQLFLVVTALVLTRLFDPASIGHLVAYVGIVSTGALVVAGRYELAVPLPSSEEDGFRLVILGVSLSVSGALLAAVLTWLGGPFVAELIGVSRPAASVLVGLGMLLMATENVLTQWAIRCQEFLYMAQARAIYAGTTGATQIVAGFSLWGPLGLLGGVLVGRIAAVVRLMPPIRQAKARFDLPSLSQIWAVAREYSRFPRISLWSAIFTLQLVPVVMSFLFGARVAGLFGLTHRVMILPTALVGTALAQVFLSNASRLKHRALGELLWYFDATARRLLLLGLIPAVVTVWFGPALFSLAFGSEWTDSGVYAQILAFFFLAEFVAAPLSQTLIVFERQGLILAWDIIRFALAMGALWLGQILSNDPRVALAAYGSVNIVALFAVVLMSRRVVARAAAITGRT